MPSTFLEAEWRKLLMFNYEIDQKLLLPYLPFKTELDTWNENCYVSLVGFRFLNTRLKGIKIPFHSDFEEVNLRFYVRFQENGAWKRGVVFIKEIVPKPALTLVANAVYGENYETLQMKHRWEDQQDRFHIEYSWKKNSWNTMKAVSNKVPASILSNSEEEFITEHYWGYTKNGPEKTSEYQVEHPRWDVYEVKENSVSVDFADLYGKQFGFLSTATPKSVLLAEGSVIKVKGKRDL